MQKAQKSSNLNYNLESFIIKTAKQYEHLKLHDHILNFHQIINNPKSKKIVNTKNKYVILDKKYKGHIYIKPKFKIEIKNKDGIYTFELEKKQNKGYKIILEKRIKINILNGVMKYTGFIKNIENEVILEKEYDSFIDEFKEKVK